MMMDTDLAKMTRGTMIKDRFDLENNDLDTIVRDSFDF